MGKVWPIFWLNKVKNWNLKPVDISQANCQVYPTNKKLGIPQNLTNVRNIGKNTYVGYLLPAGPSHVAYNYQKYHHLLQLTVRLTFAN